jgi:hypothetical protein
MGIVKATITYDDSYPTGNPEYFYGPLGQDPSAGASPRLLSVYEILDTWKVTILYTYWETLLQEIEKPDVPTDIISVTSSLDAQGVKFEIDNTGVRGVLTISGTYSGIFEQRQYDLRMVNDSLLIDADLETVGDDYYAPFNYIPDLRIWLEQDITVKVKVDDPLTGEETFDWNIKQTVLNNWEANRKRLIQIRDNLNREEEKEANRYQATALSDETILPDADGVTPVTKLR